MPAKEDSQNFAKLKNSALDLLQWSLDDISPDPNHLLRLEMGIEREGHFIPPKLRRIGGMGSDDWKNAKKECLQELAEHLGDNLPQAGGENLERIYLDDSGTFHLEMTTIPRSPKEAARATIRNCLAMIELAKERGVKARFGTLKVDFLKGQEEAAEHAFVHYHGEVFASPEGDALLLAGQAQHANVSVWCGNINLCHESPYSDGAHSLGNAMAMEAIRMLPETMLITRKGNYLRIAGEAAMSVQKIDIKHNKKDCALNWVDETDSELEPGPKSDYVRLEFRQAATDASPLDVALAAAIPVTKACFDFIKQKDGKAIVGKGGIPQFNRRGIEPAEPTDMPKSEEEAAEMFNTASNSNFEFLDTLAVRKIEKLRQKYETSGLATDGVALKKAKEDLQDIGTKLHHLYCEQYGLESAMVLPVRIAR